MFVDLDGWRYRRAGQWRHCNDCVCAARREAGARLGTAQLSRSELRAGTPGGIAKYFDRVDAIIAPNPSHPKEDAGELYDYIRPLATIEPTAIWFGLPVDVKFRLQR